MQQLKDRLVEMAKARTPQVEAEVVANDVAFRCEVKPSSEIAAIMKLQKSQRRLLELAQDQSWVFQFLEVFKDLKESEVAIQFTALFHRLQGEVVATLANRRCANRLGAQHRHREVFGFF